MTAAGGDDGAEALIPWEEIPAWIQPGITSSLRDRLLSAADTRHKLLGRKLTAAMHPHARDADLGEQEYEKSARLLHEAIAAAWAAIENASPPAPAELDYARRTWRDTGPVQATLFDAHEPARRTTPARQPAHRKRGPAQSAGSAGNGASCQPAGAPSPVTLARTSFPVPVSRATTVPPAEPARPAAASPGRHRSPARRP